MREVKRYDPINSDGTCGICVEDADYGTYVEYADYAALEAENAALRLKVTLFNEGKPYAAIKAERDALAAELAAIKGQEVDCDRSACGDFSPGRCDNPDCSARRDRKPALPAAPEGGEV